MRKILTVISVLSLISFNANALERGDISATIGVAANSAVYGASAKETNRDDSSNIRRTASESGVFTESHTSGFIELNVGEFVSLGYEPTPDSITTPQADRTTNTNAKTTVSVDFNDLNIAYLKLNTPFESETVITEFCPSNAYAFPDFPNRSTVKVALLTVPSFPLPLSSLAFLLKG